MIFTAETTEPESLVGYQKIRHFGRLSKKQENLVLTRLIFENQKVWYFVKKRESLVGC